MLEARDKKQSFTRRRVYTAESRIVHAFPFLPLPAIKGRESACLNPQLKSQ